MESCELSQGCGHGPSQTIGKEKAENRGTAQSSKHMQQRALMNTAGACLLMKEQPVLVKVQCSSAHAQCLQDRGETQPLWSRASQPVALQHCKSRHTSAERRIIASRCGYTLHRRVVFGYSFIRKKGHSHVAGRARVVLTELVKL